MQEPTLWAMVFRARAAPIAHGVGSYKNRHLKEQT